MWYRKRHVFRALLCVLCTVCLLFLLTFAVLSFILPKPTVSEREKRDLATFPAFSLESLLSGEWMQAFELYFSDTFPFREDFVGLAASIRENYGVRYDGIRVITPGNPGATQTPEPVTTTAATSATTTAVTTTPIVTTSTTVGGTSSVTSYATQTTTEATTTTPATTTTTVTTVPDPGYTIERSGAVLLFGDRAFELFGGSDKQKLLYADAVSAYAAAFPDVQVYNLVIPSSIAYYLPERYASYSVDQRSNITDLYAALSPAVCAVDVYDTLAAHANEYLYFRTDHHWTGLGAYYAYTCFARSAGFEPLAYEDYEKGTINGFLGTLAASANDSTLNKNPDYVEYCKVPVNTEAYLYRKNTPNKAELTTVLATYASGANSYSVYLAGDFPRFDIKNLDNPDGKNILVLKESYGNAFAPYLIPHYANVHVLDLRYFGGSIKDFVSEHEIDEILIIDNVFAANTRHYTDRLNTLLSR